MNITEIKLMKRKNLGNYEHEELTFTAALAEGEDFKGAIVELKELMHAALENNIVALGKVPHTVVEKVALKPLGDEPAATANIVKEKAAPRTRKAAAPKEPVKETMDGIEVPPVIPQEAVPSNKPSEVVGSVDTANVSAVKSEPAETGTPVKGQVAYDSTVKEHRSRFATYLGQNFPKWKTCRPADEIKEFSKNLHGKAFEDSKGEMLPTFKAELETFFADAK